MPRWLPPVLIALVIVVVIAAVDLGKRGHTDRTDDDHWFGGIFYFNREDSRIFVPKRFGLGIGRTLNFAHPVSWAVLLVPVIIAVVGSAGHQS